MSLDARPTGPHVPAPKTPTPQQPRPNGRPGTSPTGPSGPRPGGPGSPSGELPRIGEVIRDTERYLAQALATVTRDADPASLPRTDVQRQLAENIGSVVGFYIERALVALDEFSRLKLPPVGSAVKLPVASGNEPTPGSAATTSLSVARESSGGVLPPLGAGADFPSPGNGRPSGLVELSAPRRADRSAGSPAQAPGADGDFRLPAPDAAEAGRNFAANLRAVIEQAEFRLPRDVRDAP